MKFSSQGTTQKHLISGQVILCTPGPTESSSYEKKARFPGSHETELMRIPAHTRPQTPRRRGRHLPGRTAHGGAVQLLGQLSAQGISNTSARHGREFRRQYRWPDDRDFGRASGDATGQRDEGLDPVHETRVLGERRGIAGLRGGSPREFLAARARARQAAGLMRPIRDRLIAPGTSSELLT